MKSVAVAVCLLSSSAVAFTSPFFAPRLTATNRAKTSLSAATTAPHGGTLVNLFEGVGDKDAEAASCTKEVQLNQRQLCDVELVTNGGFSPLTGFMDEEAYLSVVSLV
jgi:sulfate adenylyltransferase